MIVIENSHLRGSGVYNIGYMGNGKYKSCVNGVEQVSYSKWRDMFDRCYSDNKKYLRIAVDGEMLKIISIQLLS